MTRWQIGALGSCYFDIHHVVLNDIETIQPVVLFEGLGTVGARCPDTRIEVTSHRAEIKICPGCGTDNRGEFPENVERGRPIRHGHKDMGGVFRERHHIPLERTAQIIEYLTGARDFGGFATQGVRRTFRVRSALDRGDCGASA